MVDKSRVPNVTDLVTSHHSALICPILRDRYSPCQLNIRYQAAAKQRSRRRFVSLIRTDKNSSKFRLVRWADKKLAMEKATAAGFLTATDLAEYLVRKGAAFRDAHSITGKVVKYCIDSNKTLTDLNLNELKQFSNLIGKDISHYISVEISVNGKKSYGGTSKEMVTARIRKIKNWK